MLFYLLKVTVIWGVFLLLFEALYKKGTHFTGNRIYLLLALITGALLPLITIPLPDSVTPANVMEGWQNVRAVALSRGITVAANNSSVINWKMLLEIVYCTGVTIFLILSLRGIFFIIRHAVYGNYEEWHHHKIFTAQKPHAPYSFMGWVFIQNPAQYKEQELDYILKHELAHRKNFHWLDLLIIQPFCILFWFHPLVWRYRYLLKLEHEYQADNEAAGQNSYDYGHFLLDQTLLKGVPPIADSFHFSPIKNRITMLTKNQSQPHSSWKYLAILPALFCCTLLMAKTDQTGKRIRKGNITTFNGNTFEWNEPSMDTIIVEDPVTGKNLMRVAQHVPIIIKSNGNATFEKNQVDNEAQYRHPKAFSQYLKDAIKRQLKTIPEGLSYIQVNNVVIDQTGTIIYYDLVIHYDTASTGAKEADNAKDRISHSVAKAIEESPVWLPATKDGKTVNEFLYTAATFRLN